MRQTKLDGIMRLGGRGCHPLRILGVTKGMATMRHSEEIREAWLRFCERFSAGDVASFDVLVSQEPAALIIGTAPGEWVTERERLRFAFETEGLQLETKDPVGYEEGSLGWVVDQPALVFPDGSVMQSRLMAVMHQVEGRWKLVHMHLSVGVPDEQVVELQQRWLAEGFSEAR
jgi:SnoaL-like protein